MSIEQAMKRFKRDCVCPRCLEEMKKGNPKMLDCAFRHNNDEHLCRHGGKEGMSFVEEFITNQCCVIIYETDQIFFDKKVYCIVSVHIENNKRTIRFGTAEQIRQICRTYKKEVNL